MAEIFGAEATKALLLQLENENAELRLTEERLTTEMVVTKRQLQERDKTLAQLESVRRLAQTPLPDRGEETVRTALQLERSRGTELERRNAKLQREVRTLEEQLRAQIRALSEAEAEAAEERAAREDTTRVADEAHEALREQETGARSAARSASKFAQSLVALESKVERHDGQMEARTREWLAERARLQGEVRRVQAECGGLRKKEEASRGRAAKAQERLLVLTQSLRTHPPSALLPVRHLSGEGEAMREAAARERRALVEGTVPPGESGSESVPLLLHDQLQRETLALRSQVHALQAQLHGSAAPTPQRWSQSPQQQLGSSATAPELGSRPSPHPKPDLSPSPQPSPGSWRAMLSRSSPAAPPLSPPGTASGIVLPASVNPSQPASPQPRPSPAAPAHAASPSSPRQRRASYESTASAGEGTPIPLRKGLPEGSSGLNIQLDAASGVPIIEQLAEALAAHHGRVIEVFREWDGDGSGTVSKQEFRQGLGRLGLREIDAQQADALFDEIDVDHSGEIQYRELNSKLRRRCDPQERKRRASKEARKGRPSWETFLGNSGVNKAAGQEAAAAASAAAAVSDDPTAPKSSLFLPRPDSSQSLEIHCSAPNSPAKIRTPQPDAGTPPPPSPGKIRTPQPPSPRNTAALVHATSKGLVGKSPLVEGVLTRGAVDSPTGGDVVGPPGSPPRAKPPPPPPPPQAETQTETQMETRTARPIRREAHSPGRRRRSVSDGGLSPVPVITVAAAAPAAEPAAEPAAAGPRRGEHNVETAAATDFGSLDILPRNRSTTPEPEWRTVARQAFARVDQEGSGYVRRAEVVLAARRDATLRKLLGLPATIRQEGGSREQLASLFAAMDRADQRLGGTASPRMGPSSDDSRRMGLAAFAMVVRELLAPPAAAAGGGAPPPEAEARAAVLPAAAARRERRRSASGGDLPPSATIAAAITAAAAAAAAEATAGAVAPVSVPLLQRRPSVLEAEARGEARRQSLERSNCYLTAATPAEVEAAAAEAAAAVVAEAAAEAEAEAAVAEVEAAAEAEWVPIDFDQRSGMAAAVATDQAATDQRWSPPAAAATASAAEDTELSPGRKLTMDQKLKLAAAKRDSQEGIDGALSSGEAASPEAAAAGIARARAAIVAAASAAAAVPGTAAATAATTAAGAAASSAPLAEAPPPNSLPAASWSPGELTSGGKLTWSAAPAVAVAGSGGEAQGAQGEPGPALPLCESPNFVPSVVSTIKRQASIDHLLAAATAPPSLPPSAAASGGGSAVRLPSERSAAGQPQPLQRSASKLVSPATRRPENVLKSSSSKKLSMNWRR